MSNFLPNELIQRLKNEPDFNPDAFIEAHEHEQKTTSIRLNQAKISALPASFEVDTPVPWCSNGYFLRERPSYTLDPFFHAGCYYPQEASSMFLAYVLEVLHLTSEPIRALDLCAAPGGKSTLLQSYLTAESLLVSNEIIKARAHILEDNMVKWGGANSVVSNNDPSAFKRLPGYFDLVVVDAPCSGSGMFRKDHHAISEWSEANVKLCAERQKRILADSLDSLRTDGYLFYSTCSYSREENEEIVDWLVKTQGFSGIAVQTAESWGIVTSYSTQAHVPTYRFYPHKVSGEGFFCAILQKKAEQTTWNRKKIKVERNSAPQDVAAPWVDTSNMFSFIHQDQLHLFPAAYRTDLQVLQQALYLKNAGTRIGKWNGKTLIPLHDLALSQSVRNDLPALDLDEETAVRYLRKEALDVSVNNSGNTGWLLVRYSGANLGWVKAMENRINNYYPKEIRIVHL